jgi:pyruvate ferredoxin oxidoreductase delta subunit
MSLTMPSKNKKLPGWRDITMGGLATEPGNSIDYDTGSWEDRVLVFYDHICIHCMQCWIVCPDSTILAKDGKIIGIDLGHCKDCGLCVEACPTEPKSLEFVRVEDLLMGVRSEVGSKTIPAIIHEVKQNVSERVAEEAMERLKETAREVIVAMTQELGRNPTAAELLKKMGKDSGLTRDMANALVSENGTA